MRGAIVPVGFFMSRSVMIEPLLNLAANNSSFGDHSIVSWQYWHKSYS